MIGVFPFFVCVVCDCAAASVYDADLGRVCVSCGTLCDMAEEALLDAGMVEPDAERERMMRALTGRGEG